MFNIPETYRKDKYADLRAFIPKDLNPNDKKRLRESLKAVRLSYQIEGEEIPSVYDETYRCQAIQFYDMELKNIKDASFVASFYQNLIKPFCVIHLYDEKEEVYSYALKRLNQNDDTQVVLEDSLVTHAFMINLPDGSRERFMGYADFSQTKNKQDKVSLYKEWFYKVYILEHEKAYAESDKVLDGNLWYDSSRTARTMLKYRELVKQRDSLKKATTNAEKMKINKNIKVAINELSDSI
jgi:hypothetical protein